MVAFAPKIDVNWGKAVTQLRGMGEIVEDVEKQTWAPGAAASKYATDGWADGRAEFVLRAMEGMTIDELTADLPSEDQAWVRAAYVIIYFRIPHFRSRLNLGGPTRDSG